MLALLPSNQHPVLDIVVCNERRERVLCERGAGWGVLKRKVKEKKELGVRRFFFI